MIAPKTESEHPFENLRVFLGKHAQFYLQGYGIHDLLDNYASFTRRFPVRDVKDPNVNQIHPDTFRANIIDSDAKLAVFHRYWDERTNRSYMIVSREMEKSRIGNRCHSVFEVDIYDESNGEPVLQYSSGPIANDNINAARRESALLTERAVDYVAILLDKKQQPGIQREGHHIKLVGEPKETQMDLVSTLLAINRGFVFCNASAYRTP